MYIFQKTRNLLKKHPIEAELYPIQSQLDVFLATLAKIDMNFKKSVRHPKKYFSHCRRSVLFKFHIVLC